MKKEKRIKLLSERNRNRSILYGIIAVLSIIVLRSIFFFLIFGILCAMNVYLMFKAQSSEEALVEKMKKSEEAMADDLSESEKSFLQKYTNSNKRQKSNDNDWISQRIKQMEEEDAYYDALEEDEDNEYEDE